MPDLEIHDQLQLRIGIDIEQISLMPPSSDYREDHFYTSNFSPSEIAYCILQPDTAASFAGLFAAKEAIVKADNSYLKRDFNSIKIDHLPNGKPTFPSFSISISHTAQIAVAVAVRLPNEKAPVQSVPSTLPNFTGLYFLLVVTLLLSLAAILLVFFFNH